MEKIMHVFLGRFAPFHKGHQEITENLIKKYGEHNILILIGSSNSLNEKTPYTFSERKKTIKTIYPNISILPLPDSTKNIQKFTDKGNQIWFKKIKSLEKSLNAKFTFYGGGLDDLEILSEEFPVEVMVNRKITNISATKVRELIKEKKYKELEHFLDKRIIPLATKYLRVFKT